MSKRKNIAPIPTTYHGQRFRSRLEAKWGVILDTLPNVLHWQYEPKTYHIQQTGWDYTPDFLVTIFFNGNKHHLYLEVKPGESTEDYHNFLLIVSHHTRWPIVLFECPLWAPVGKTMIFTACQFLPKTKHAQPFNFSDAMPNIDRAIRKALDYRFDLK